MKARRLMCILGALSILGLATSCSEEPPRPIREINDEQNRLPTLYLTESGEELITEASPTGGPVVHPDLGKLAFPAHTCNNPGCPAKGTGKNGRPYLFAWPDPSYQIVSGKAESRRFASLDEYFELCKEKGVSSEPACPACLKQRDLENENEEQKQQYRGWVAQYALPETIERMKELNEERKQRLKILEERRKFVPPKIKEKRE